MRTMNTSSDSLDSLEISTELVSACRRAFVSGACFSCHVLEYWFHVGTLCLL